MMVIETCPKCGGRLDSLVLTSYPPIPAKRCYSCGYYWQGEPEKIVYKPFHPNEGMEVWQTNSVNVHTLTTLLGI